MVTYMTLPQNQLTLGSTVFSNKISNARIQRLENGFDNGVITLEDITLYPSTVTQGTAVQLDVKDSSDTAWTTILKGVVRFPTFSTTEAGSFLSLHCDGSGYGFGEMLVGNEYGTQSTHATTDTLTEIATDIVNAYVNKILNGADSNYNYTISATNANSIAYINFPYKPADKCLNDLMDLVTAQNAGTAGPHWIVTTDDVLHIKLVDGTQVGWTKYYGDSQANATLTYGVDYTEMDFEKLNPEANYVLYYGAWRRPGNGDSWTENKSASWDTEATSALTDDGTYHQIGSYSLRATSSGVGNVIDAYYPDSQDAAWDFTSFTSFNIPYLNFYFRRHNNEATTVYLKEDDTNYFYYTFTSVVPDQDTWYHIKLPIGPYYKIADPDLTWSEALTPNWNNINWIGVATVGSAAADYICLDGLYFGDAAVCRVAWDSTFTGTAHMRIITDNIGKDDTLKAGTPGDTDTGLMAQYAYSEFLRLSTTPLLGNITNHMIKDVLPGQYFNIQGSDMRTTKIVHTISDLGGYKSVIHLSDDLVNARSRLRYEETNKVWADMRPEWQDRQASTLKAGTVDWNITRLVEDYA